MAKPNYTIRHRSRLFTAIFMSLALSGLMAPIELAPRAAHAQPLAYPSCGNIGPGAFCAAAYGAKCDGATDDTAALNAGLAAAALGIGSGIRSAWNEFFIPAGTCIVSGQLTFGSNQAYSKRVVVRGFGIGVTTIQLANGSAAFQSTSNPLAIFSSCAGCGGDVVGFAVALRDLSINAGYGNPGAAGAQMLVNNSGGMSNVNIACPGICAGAGLDLTQSYQGPSTYDTVKITGFATGVATLNAEYIATFKDLTLIGQSNYGIYNGGGFVFAIDGLTSVNTVPTVWMAVNGYGTIIDANIATPSATPQPAIYVTSKPGAYSALHIQNASIGPGFQASGTTSSGVAIGPGQISCATVYTIGGATTYNPSCVPMTMAYMRPTIPAPDPIGQWASTANVLTGAAIQSVMNTCQAGSTATTIYLNNKSNGNDYNVASTIVIPPCVNRVIGFGARVNAASGFNAATCLFTIASRPAGSPPLILEDFETALPPAPSIPYICNPNGASVLIRDILFDATGQSYVATGGQTSNASAFLIDIANGTVNVTGQNVFAWGLDSENSNTRVINNGGNFQVVGFKSESTGGIAQNNGGTMSIFGGYLLLNYNAPLTMPAFDVPYGSLSLDYAEASNYPANRGHTAFTVLLGQSTNGTVLQTVAGNPAAPLGWYYVNLTGATTLPGTQTYLDVGGGVAVGAGDANHILTVGP